MRLVTRSTSGSVSAAPWFMNISMSSLSPCSRSLPLGCPLIFQSPCPEPPRGCILSVPWTLRRLSLCSYSFCPPKRHPWRQSAGVSPIRQHTLKLKPQSENFAARRHLCHSEASLSLRTVFEPLSYSASRKHATRNHRAFSRIRDLLAV